jgi:DNA polymerase
VVNARQAAYLQALGVDVYVPRSAPPLEAEPVVAVADPVAPPLERAARVDQQGPTVDPSTAPASLPDIARDLGWDELRSAVAACQRCDLHGTRTQTVFGVGHPGARWMFIGEAPGVEEDARGEPFVGRAGQLLTSMLRALGLQRDDVFIANVLKCRPPNNRDPKPGEAASCRTFLERQVALVNPTLVIAVGRIAKLRGKVHAFGARSWPLLVTYHPAYLLRTPREKRKAWQDLLQARQLFERLQREATGGGGS